MRGFLWSFFIVFLISHQGLAQDSLRIGDAFDYLSYKSLKKHIETKDHYFSASDVGVVRWDKDYSFKLLSKVNGLSDVEPEVLAYDSKTDAVIIAYANSNIDILYPEQTVNVRDILINQKIIGRRTINKLIADNGILYIIADYGVSLYDLQSASFILTLFTDDQTRDFVITPTDFYISTLNEFYRFSREKDISLMVTLTHWNKLGVDNQLPAIMKPGKIGVNSTCIIIQDGTDLLRANLDDLQFSPLKSLYETDEVPFINSREDEIQIGVHSSATKDHILKVGNNCEITDSLRSSCFNAITDYLETKSGEILVGSAWAGFYHLDKDGACNVSTLPGPRGVQAYDLTFWNDTLYITNGGSDKLRYFPQHRAEGFAYYDGKHWHNHSKLLTPELSEKNFGDIMQVIPSQDGKKLYLNSAWKGFAEYDFNKFKVYDHTNSCLETVGDFDMTVRIPTMTMDKDGNIWMSNYYVDNGIKVWGADGSCRAIKTPVGPQLGEMIFDQEGNLWSCIIGSEGNILIYNPDREEFRIISNSNSILSGDARSLAMDKNGAVWVGATNGVYVFYDAFHGTGVRPVVDINKDGQGDYLLMDQLVTAIGIDAANRKWFGTQNGVIVQSSSGLENELRLTTDNSALPSNHITSFAFDETRGITYIGTDKGVLAVKTVAVHGKKVHSKDVYAYPNPVRPDYNGPIAIKGLAENAHVRIVDQQGFLVKVLEAYGGQAIWDGTNLNNERVSSGVYLVFSSGYSTNFKPDAAATKILVVK